MAVTVAPETTSDDNATPAAGRRTRIDAPHPGGELDNGTISGEAEQSHVRAERELLEVIEEPAEELVAAVIGDNLEIRREQLQLQVSQLAEHLRQRLREVDRREAQLHARAAQVEAELRASRLWLSEHQTAAQERESDLRRRIEELEERPAGEGSAIAMSGQNGDRNGEDHERSLFEREQQISHFEGEVRQRRHEADRQAAALRHAQQLWEQQRLQQERELAEQRETLTREFQALVAEREEQLQTAERLVQEHSQRLDAERGALLADRQAWQEQQAQQRRAIDERSQAADAELLNRRQRLEARQDWIERQKSSLEQVRGEILALHRQSLEMRLLAEQLWSQVTGRLSPAEITQSIAQLRVKLAEQYKLEEENLAGRRQELVQLGERIAQQHRELAQLRSGLRDWAAAREAEIERQAAALVQRELALDEQQQAHRRAAADWSAERRRYDQQLRELTAQLRTLPAAA